MTVGPTGCSANRNELTTPKFPPPPRSAQNRSGCSWADARTMSPSAVTTSASRRLSTVSPCLRMSQPMPPPRLRPPTPVWPTMPPVVARPWAWVSWSTSPHRAPPCTWAVRSTGSTETARIDGEVDDDPVVAQGGAGHVVASAPHRDLEVAVPCEAHRRGHVGDAAASGDQPGAPVDRTVPHGAGVVVVGVLGGDHLASEAGDPLAGHRVARPADSITGRCCHRSSFGGRAHRNTGGQRREVSKMDFEVRNLDFTAGRRLATLQP